MENIFIGTASWGVPKEHQDFFPVSGTHLERYAQVFNAVEINSSFYRHHQAKTYARWAQCVPAGFRFSVKLSRVFTHDQKLQVQSAELSDVFGTFLELNEKLGVVLIQLPPSVQFTPMVAEDFFAKIRNISEIPLQLEPRHPSWGRPEVGLLLKKYQVGKVLADPEKCVVSPDFADPRFRYHRWHGSPQIYKSSYSKSALNSLAAAIKLRTNPQNKIWCIFDNTAMGHATANAHELRQLL